MLEWYWQNWAKMLEYRLGGWIMEDPWFFFFIGLPMLMPVIVLYLICAGVILCL